MKIYLIIILSFITLLEVKSQSISSCSVNPLTATSLPAVETFDDWQVGATFFPTCWYRYYASTPQPTSTVTPHYGSTGRSLQLYSYSNRYAFVAIQRFGNDVNINDVEISFFMRAKATNDEYLDAALEVGIMTNQTNINTFTPVTMLTLSAGDVWEEKNITLSSYTPPPGNNSYYLAFRVSAAAGVTNQCYIDNLQISVAEGCPNVFDFNLTLAGNNVVNASWNTAAASSTGWIVAYDQVAASSFNPATAANQTVVTAAPYPTPSLTSGETYTFAMRTNCEGSAWTTPIEIYIPYFVTIPYYQNFENLDDVGEITLHSNSVNQWYIGSGEGNPGNSMYISSNNGISATYNIYVTTYSYAEIPIDFGNHLQYQLSFDWKAGGEITWHGMADFLRVYAVPSNYSVSTTSLPNINIPGISIVADSLVLRNTWQHATYTLEAANFANTTRKLLFLWTNDNSEGDQPAAAVDNIALTGSSCLTPVSLQVSGITTQNATISWTSSANQWRVYIKNFETGNIDSVEVSTTPVVLLNNLAPNSCYKVWIKANCSGEWSGKSSELGFCTSCAIVTSLPYHQNFDFYQIGQFPYCWTKMGGFTASNNTNYPAVTQETSVSNPNSLEMRSNLRSVIISPQFEADAKALQISFKAKRSNFNAGKLYYGFMSNMTDINGFFIIDTIFGKEGETIQDDEWYEFTRPLDVETSFTPHYIAFLQEAPSSVWSFFIDDVVVDSSKFCYVVTNISATNVNMNSATLSWVPGSNENGWLLYYKEAGTANWTFEEEIQGYSVYNLTNLMPNQTYEVCIKGLCRNGDTTECAPFIFTTECAAITLTSLPYIENFDTYGTGTIYNQIIPDCWKMYSNTNVIPHISDVFVYSPQGSLLFLSSGANAYNIACSPRFDVPIQNLMLSLYFRTIYQNDKIVLGVMENRNNISSFTPIDTLSVDTGGRWKHFVKVFTEYEGSGKYIAFKTTNQLTQSYVYIDNFKVNEFTGCPKAANFDSVEVTHNKIKLIWNHEDFAQTYEIQIKYINATNWLGQVNNIIDTTYTLTGLQPNTEYLIRMRSSCTNNYYSVWDTLIVKTRSGIGISEINDYNLKIYPNPASNQIQIQSDKLIEKIDIYDLLGKLQSSSNINNLQKAIIDVSNIRNGTYFLKIKYKNELTITKKVVISK